MTRSGTLATALVFITATTALNPAIAQNDEPTAREKELIELVQRLTERIDKLETRLDKAETAEPATFAPAAQEPPHPPPSAEEAEMHARVQQWFADGHTLRPYWKDGLRFDSLDGSFKLKIGGRIQHDWAYLTEDDRLEQTIGSNVEDGNEFRRARLYVSGTIYDNIEFKAQYDFAGGDADFKDVYMGLKKVPVVGGVRVGHFKEPFSIEELTSSKYLTLMERSLVNTFAPGRNAGIMLHDHILDDRMTWAAGFFREADGFGDGGGGGRDYNATVRLTGLPWYQDDGSKLLHLGVAYTHKNFEGDTVRYRARPEAHLSPRLVDTGAFSAEYADILGLEAAWVQGPFSLQGEFAQSFVESRTIRDPKFWAASLQASYFLTGEHRPYNLANGTFGNVKPKRNFQDDGGSGAWELATRYSYLDLSDETIDGGWLRDFTFGLNWYLNPNLRVMWNYIFAESSDAGEMNIFQWRFQIAF